MLRSFRRRRKDVGLPPGSLVYTGDTEKRPSRISILDYGKDSCEEKVLENVEGLAVFKDSRTISWINVDGLHDIDLVRKIGSEFGIHPLVLEDILHTDQRPKVEDHGEHVYLSVKMLYLDVEQKGIVTEQVSFVLGSHYLITFQEKEGDVFELIRQRLRENKGRVRTTGADYLAYALIDAIVDHYYVILEKIGNRIEAVEQKVMSDDAENVTNEIHFLKREMMFLRRQVWPLRELVNALVRGDARLFQKSTNIFLRDVYDHTVQVIDTIELYRDMLQGIHDVQLSLLSNRMNEVMKVLTIFAAIFIPLTFIAGIYGMNFQYMPELQWRGGYFTVLSVMAVIGVGMLVYFRKKDWL